MERHHLKSLGIDGRIIFEGSGMGRHGLDCSQQPLGFHRVWSIS